MSFFLELSNVLHFSISIQQRQCVFVVAAALAKRLIMYRILFTFYTYLLAQYTEIASNMS